MIDIDLIPPEYHRKKKFFSLLKKAISVQIFFSVLLAVAFVFLTQKNDELQTNIKQLQSQKSISKSHRSQLQTQDQLKKDYSQQLQLLAGLRSGASAEKMFITIDKAMPDEYIWISNWKFRRAGTPIDSKTITSKSSYFIVIPKSNNSKTPEKETWKIETQMTLEGKSLDHAAISQFALNLTQQPVVESVKILNTQLTEVNKIKVVNFTLNIIVSAQKKDANG